MKNCHLCGVEGLVETREEVQYRALPGTTLVDIKVETCPSCGERFEHIPAISQLDDALLRSLVRKQARLMGPEIRFLRKCLGLSATDMAAKMRVTKETMSRWETGAREISPQNDLLLRLIVASSARLDGFSDDIDQVATMAAAPMAASLSWARQRWADAA